MSKHAADFRKSVWGAFCRSGQNVALNIISVPVMAYIIRGLGPVPYGQWTTATALVSTVAVLNNLGLRAGFIRDVARDPTSAGRRLAAQLGARMILALLAALIATICGLLLYPALVQQCIAITVFGSLLGIVFTSLSDLLEAQRKFPQLAGVSFISGLLLTAASVLAIYFGGGAIAVALAYLVGPITTTLMLAWMVRDEKIPIRFEFHPIRSLRLLWNCRHFAIQALLFTANTNLSLLILPKMVGPAAFGLYSGGVLLITRLGLFPDALGTAFYPLIAKCHATDRTAARRHLLDGAAVSAGICIAIALTATLFAGFISRILFPHHADDCRRIIQITIWALPLTAIESMFGYALNGAGKEGRLARATFLAAVCNLLLGAAVIWVWQVPGACWIMLVRSLVQIAFILPDVYDAFHGRSERAAPLHALAAAAK